MKKIWLLILFIIQLVPTWCGAQTMVTTKTSSAMKGVKLTSFPDYAPISYVAEDDRGREYLRTIFSEPLQEFAQLGNFKLEYILMENYDEAVSKVRRGELDVLIGIYYGTKQYDGLEYIYPAVLNNPVNVIMMPQSVAKVKNSEDLKALKGVYSQEEYFSDYMLKNFASFNIKPAESTLAAYEKLFTGEVDYIVGTYYYNYVKACELGLKNYISFSQTAMWNMPMFFGVSKTAPDYKRISALLKKTVAKPDFISKLNTALKAEVKKLELNSQGVVPPEFVRKSADADVTPADEEATNLLGYKGE